MTTGQTEIAVDTLADAPALQEEPQVDVPAETPVGPIPSETEIAAVARAEAAEARAQQNEKLVADIEQENQAARIEQALVKTQQQYMENGDSDEVAQAKAQGDYRVWQAQQDVGAIRTRDGQKMEAALEYGEKYSVSPKHLMAFNSRAEMEQAAKDKAEINQLKAAIAKLNGATEQQFDNNRGSAPGRTEFLGMKESPLTDDEHRRLGKRLGQG